MEVSVNAALIEYVKLVHLAADGRNTDAIIRLNALTMHPDLKDFDCAPKLDRDLAMQCREWIDRLQPLYERKPLQRALTKAETRVAAAEWRLQAAQAELESAQDEFGRAREALQTRAQLIDAACLQAASAQLKKLIIDAAFDGAGMPIADGPK